MARSVDGTSSPSALAVLRLITVSCLVANCTGRSAAFSPLENTVNVPSCPPIFVEEIRTIGRQAASGDEEGLVVDCGKLVPGSKCDNQIANRCRVRGRGHDQASVGGACECRDGALDLRLAHAD